MPDVFLSGSTTCTGRITGGIGGDWSLGGSTRAGGRGFLTGPVADQDLDGSTTASGSLAGDLSVGVDIAGSERPGGRIAGDMAVEAALGGSVVALAHGSCQLVGGRSQTPLRVLGRLLEGGLVLGFKWAGDVLPIQAASAAPVAAPADGKGVVFQDDGTIWIWDGAAWQQVSGGGGGASPLTTKGDLFGYDTGDARIPVGADDELLVADSSQPLGVRWGSEFNIDGGFANSTYLAAQLFDGGGA